MPTFSPGVNYNQKKRLKTNHFEMKITLPSNLFRYDVEIKKEITLLIPVEEQPSTSTIGPHSTIPAASDQPKELKVNKLTTKKIMILLVHKLSTLWKRNNEDQNNSVIHDFSRIIYSTKALNKPSGVPLEYELKHSDLPDEDDDICVYKVKLIPAAFNVDLSRLSQLLEARDFSHSDLDGLKQVYNILMKNLGDETYTTIGRSNLMKIAEPNKGNALGWGMMNWSGVSAICTLGATWKPFLNIDIQNSAYLIGQTVLDAIAEIFADKYGTPNKEKARDVNQLDERDEAAVNSVLNSCVVRRTVNKKIRDSTVRCVLRMTAAQKTFTNTFKQTISVAKHFEDNGTPVINWNAPIVQLGPKSFVPAEGLTIKKGQSVNRILSGQPQKDMLKKCTAEPLVKHNDILAKMGDLKVFENPLLAEFGVSLPNQNMLELHGRVLKAPNLQYGYATESEGGQRGKIIPSDGVWNMWDHSLKFYRPAKIDAWAVVTVGVNQRADEFVSMMQARGKVRGMIFPQPICSRDVRIQKRKESHDLNVRELTKAFREIKRNFGNLKNCFILCVIPWKPSEQYSQVKQAAEREGGAGVLTQCLQVGNWEKPNDSIVNNVLLKLNAKLGGINHVPIIDDSLLKKINILRFPTLILGIDVNHPSLPIKGKPTGHPSFASVTGSIDRTGMPYMMHVQAQLREGTKAIGAAEVIENLDVIVNKMILKFQVTSNYFPGRIIVLRDGVGESQFPEILHKEMMAIRRACTSVKADYKPPITFLAVQKRHKVRFFKMDGNGIPEGRAGNVPAGTVVDTEIVQRNNSDFYLLSHSGLMGTSRPTHYHVLWDDSDFSMDDIQGLAYHLCHAYSRCNRAVSYPAPTYYAHWAALRAKALANGYKDWEGDQKSVDRLNKSLQREDSIQMDFPMHFI